MKIAVTYEAERVFQHFGHTPAFKIYEVEQDRVVSTQVVPTGSCGHGALAGFLKELGVDVLICGGIGGGAQMALTNAGIRFFGGINAECDDAVTDLLAGQLSYNPCVTCNHHGHDHNCGDHGCGNSCH